MEGWMVSAAIAVAGLIGMIYVNKYKVDDLKESFSKALSRIESNHTKDLDEIKRQTQKELESVIQRQVGIGRKVDEHSETLGEHKIIVNNAVTMEQVDSKFLTRDLFRAHEKHIDQRFQSIEKKLDAGFGELKELIATSDRGASNK